MRGDDTRTWCHHPGKMMSRVGVACVRLLVVASDGFAHLVFEYFKAVF